MPFIGNQPALSYTSFAKQDFTTSATTSYTLDQPVANENEIALFINFVRQEPTTAYTASGTTLTLTSATSASDDMYCVFLGKAVQTVNPPNSSVGISQLSATGTKDATTFLRGDNTFAEAGGGKVLQVVQTLKTNTESVTGTSFADITGLNVSITPSSSSSKILIMLTMTYGGSGDIYPAFKLLRGATTVTTATDLQGSCISATFGANAYYDTNTENLSYTFLDSPSTTSATTYKIQVRPMGTLSRTFYLNRPGNTSDSNRYQGTTTLTAMEISA